MKNRSCDQKWNGTATIGHAKSKTATYQQQCSHYENSVNLLFIVRRLLISRCQVAFHVTLPIGFVWPFIHIQLYSIYASQCFERRWEQKEKSQDDQFVDDHFMIGIDTHLYPSWGFKGALYLLLALIEQSVHVDGLQIPKRCDVPWYQR